MTATAPNAGKPNANHQRNSRWYCSGSGLPAAPAPAARSRMRACIQTTGSQKAGEKIEHDRKHIPVLAEPVADIVDQRDAGHRLHHHCGGREDQVGDHHDAGDAADNARVSGAMRQQHEKGDARAGTEQHARADDVQVLARNTASVLEDPQRHSLRRRWCSAQDRRRPRSMVRRINSSAASRSWRGPPSASSSRRNGRPR